MVLRKLAGAGGQRALWTMADQALSSLSTAIMSITVAKVSTNVDFGRFSLAFVVYTFMIGIERALATTPFIIHHGGADRASREREGATAAGVSMLLGVAGGFVITLISVPFGSGYRAPMITMAIMLGGVLMQDAWRMLLISIGRPLAAVCQDGLVVLLQVGTFAFCILGHHRDPEDFICAWAVPTTLAAMVGLFQWGAAPQAGAAWAFLQGHWETSRFLLAEYVAVQGASQIAWLLIPALGTAADVGALRGGMTLLGMLNIVGNSVYMFALAEIVRRGITQPRPLIRIGMVVTAFIAVVSAAAGILLMLLPHRAGHALLGSTWDLATVTLLPLTLYMVGVAFSTGPQAVMRSRADTRSTFRVNLVLGPLLLACVSIGQVAHGAQGAAWGFATATILTAPLWWLMAKHTVQRAA